MSSESKKYQDQTASPLIVIVGQTASGKTALALEIAEKFGGEIICADSRTIYREMNIGTAKPSPAEQSRIPHYLLDVIDPDERFSVADFKRLANEAIHDISSRGKLPILVGGTGLYIDAIIFDFQFGAKVDEQLRVSLASETIESLQTMIEKLGYPMPENRRNKRYLIRTIERGGEQGGRGDLRPDTLVIGLDIDRELLKQRISDRVDTMLENGFVTEVKTLVSKYGEDALGLLAPGYKAFLPYLRGDTSLEAARVEFIRNDFRLSKRQQTWFKRNKSIQWLNERSKAVDLATTFLNKYNVCSSKNLLQ